MLTLIADLQVGDAPSCMSYHATPLPTAEGAPQNIALNQHWTPGDVPVVRRPVAAHVCRARQQLMMQALGDAVLSMIVHDCGGAL